MNVNVTKEENSCHPIDMTNAFLTAGFIYNHIIKFPKFPPKDFLMPRRFLLILTLWAIMHTRQ